MKKLMYLMVCCLLIVSMAPTTLAADNQTELTLTVPADLESYTLTIPATVGIDTTTKTGAVQVKLSDVSLIWSKQVCVDVTSTNGGYLVNNENDALKMQYQVKSTYDGTVKNGGFTTIEDVVEYRADVHTGGTSQGTLEITVLDSYPGAGTYSDTLTFSVSVG